VEDIDLCTPFSLQTSSTGNMGQERVRVRSRSCVYVERMATHSVLTAEPLRGYPYSARCGCAVAAWHQRGDGMYYSSITSVSDRYHADSGVVGSNHCSTPGDPRVVEREQWFLFRNWRRWPGT
jgi:hypothetical protein